MNAHKFRYLTLDAIPLCHLNLIGNSASSTTCKQWANIAK